ncbi:unnamed protein product [Auanema sp. JU1783]|nr:unnamed protein product [Auanema sp. JU1783]
MVTSIKIIDFIVFEELERDDNYDVFLGFNITHKEEAYIKLTESKKIGVYPDLRFRMKYENIEVRNKLKVYYIDREGIQGRHHESDLTIKGKGSDTHYIVNATFNNVYHTLYGSEYMWTSIFGNILLEEREKLAQEKCYEVKVKRRVGKDIKDRFYITEIPKEVQADHGFLGQFKEFMTSTESSPLVRKRENSRDSAASKPYKPPSFLPQFSSSLSEIKLEPQLPPYRKTRDNKSDKEFMKKEVKDKNVILVVSTVKRYAWNKDLGIVPFSLTKTCDGREIVEGWWYNATIKYTEVTQEKPTGLLVTSIMEPLELYKTRKDKMIIYVQDTFQLEESKIKKIQDRIVYDHFFFGNIGLDDNESANEELYKKPILFVLKMEAYRKHGVFWKVSRIGDSSDSRCNEKDVEQFPRMNMKQHSSPPKDVVVYNKAEVLEYRSRDSTSSSRELFNPLPSNRADNFTSGVICRIERDHAIVFSHGNIISSLVLTKWPHLSIGDTIRFHTRANSPYAGCDSEILENTVHSEDQKQKWQYGERGIPQFDVSFQRHSSNNPEYIYQNRLGYVMVSTKDSVFGSVIAWLKSTTGHFDGYVSLSFDESSEKYKWILVDVAKTAVYKKPTNDALHLLYTLWKDTKIMERIYFSNREAFVAMENTFTRVHSSNNFESIEH